MATIQIKKTIGAFALLVFCMACSSTKRSGKSQKLMPGTWQSQPISIDGDCTDWPSPYPNYDAKAMVAYATSNDQQNLYVTMQTGDPLTQIKILKQGMIVSIDTGGKRDPKFHISFPLQNDEDVSELFAHTEGGKNSGPPQLGRSVQQKLKKSAESSNQFSLDGLGTCNGVYMVSQTTPCGIKVKVSIDEYNQLVWEAQIPFSAIYNTENITPAYAGKGISVCYAVKGFKNPNGKTNDNAPVPMNNGGGGMGGGMGAGGRTNSMPMAGPSGGTGNRENPAARLYENTKTWKHFAIAWK